MHASTPDSADNPRSEHPDGTYDASIIAIEGVVSPFCRETSLDSTGNLAFYLHAWRIPGEAVVERRLMLQQKFNDPRRWNGAYEAGSIHRWDVRLSKDKKRARVMDLSSAPADTLGLSLFADELNTPVIVHSPLLGALTLDRHLHLFNGTANWDGREVEVVLDAASDGKHPDEKALAFADSLWSASSYWSHKIKSYMVDDLLPTYNEHWRDDEESETDPTSFAALFWFKAIEIRESGWVTFFFGTDSGLFGDHAPDVELDLADGSLSATL
ncbi:MAG TPA: DUF2262 domain-containing protein [Flavobacteriales bacterium]|nr:DUF2262 domain-containing protein [Flavobacteriales bacterium]